MKFYLLLAFLCWVSGEDGPLVETTLGKIKGYYKTSYNGRRYAAFEGIPYAKPPIGDLRFEEPQKAEPWSDVKLTNKTYSCPQVNFMTLQSMGAEDCLYLNVYVPSELSSKKNLDVLVHIHGGAFTMGASGMAGPTFLMDSDIVYVTVNYRLGIFGFLSTEDDIVPGNNGMKDQVLALKWTQDHISTFGGNPNSVTIIGLSAGGASVHLHYFSPLSKGLFHRGISNSGTALGPWAIVEKPLEYTNKLAAAVDCVRPSNKEIVECLKQQPFEELSKKTYSFSPYLQYPITPFGPVVEKKHKGAFLSEEPYVLLKKGEVTAVPWLSSITSEEGVMASSYFDKLDLINEEWDTFMPLFMDYNQTATKDNKVKVSREIKRFYFNNEDVSEKNLNKLIDLFGDRYFVIGHDVSSRLQSIIAPVYNYVFGYRANIKIPEFTTTEKDYGVSHGSDGMLLYEFSFMGTILNPGRLSKTDEKVKNMQVDIVTSFVRNGVPQIGSDWKPVTINHLNYILINRQAEAIAKEKTDFTAERFWNELPLEEYEKLTARKEEL